MGWLRRLFGGTDSSSEPAERVEAATAPESDPTSADAPPAPDETSEASGDEPERAG